MDINNENDIKENSSSIQRKKRKCRPILTRWLNDMLSSSTLHGIPYLTKKNITVIERIFWLLTFIVSIALSSLFIHQVWVKWQTSPVIVSFNEKLVPVGQVPFPSVTICPQRKTLKKIYNYSAEYNFHLNVDIEITNSTMRRYEKLENVALLCDTYPPFNFGRERGNLSIIDDIIEVSPKIDDVFHQCTWRRKDMPCPDLFTEVLTSEGLCFNFNSLAADEMLTNEDGIHHNHKNHNISSKGWTFENGYDDREDDPYPKRGREQGGFVDLDVILVDDKNDRDSLCNSMSPGYKVYLQHPADRPLSFVHYHSIEPNKLASMGITVSMLSSSDTINKYSPNTRQCFFPNEKKLRHYRIYTPTNCQFECRSNYTIEKCGCVWFNMPYNDTEHYCSLESMQCYFDAIEDLVNKEMKEDAEGACNCLPACNSIEYAASVIQAKFVLETFLDSMEDDMSFEELKHTEFSRLQMYFKGSRFISMHRSELFGLTDFLANCGGLLGLFLGFSFLSLVEILYFLTIRISCMLRRENISNEDQ